MKEFPVEPTYPLYCQYLVTVVLYLDEWIPPYDHDDGPALSPMFKDTGKINVQQWKLVSNKWYNSIQSSVHQMLICLKTFSNWFNISVSNKIFSDILQSIEEQFESKMSMSVEKFLIIFQVIIEYQYCGSFMDKYCRSNSCCFWLLPTKVDSPPPTKINPKSKVYVDIMWPTKSHHHLILLKFMTSLSQ